MTRRAALRGVTFGLGGQLLQVAIALAGWVVLARYVDARELGLAAMALVFPGLLAVGADFGMAVLAVQRKRVDDVRAHEMAVSAGLGLVLLLGLGSPLLARLYGSPEGLAPLIGAAGVSLLFAAFASNARARVQRDLGFGRLALVDGGVESVRAVARVWLAVAGYGAWSIVLGDLIALGLGAAAVWLCAPPMQRGPDRALAPDGLRLVGARAADAAFVQADRFAVGSRLGASALGLYAFAWQHTQMAAQRLTAVAEQVALPLLARAVGERELVRGYLTLTRWYALAVLPLAALLHLFARPLVDWLYPERWAESVEVLRALAAALAAHALNSHPGLVWIVRGRMRLRMIWSVTNLVLVAALLPLGLRGGLRGVAWVLAARSLVATVASLEITARMVPLRRVEYLRALAPGAALGAGVTLLGTLAG